MANREVRASKPHLPRGRRPVKLLVAPSAWFATFLPLWGVSGSNHPHRLRLTTSAGAKLRKHLAQQKEVIP